MSDQDPHAAPAPDAADTPDAPAPADAAEPAVPAEVAVPGDAVAPAEAYDRLPEAVTDLFGDEAAAESAYDLLTVDVPAATWLTALRTARDELGCTYFDWLSAVDEPGVGFRVCAHVAALGTGSVRRLMVRTTVPHGAAVLPSAVDVYAGAAWHERETHEMFGVAFDGHPHLVPLLLPEGFEGHPLRKDFVLAARVAKAWPGAKEPGEPADGHTGPKRRAMLPPGVPDPNEWGPLKGQLPPAAARPARAARTAADRPPRRTRSASEGSAAQRPTHTGAETRTETGAGAQAPTATGPEARTGTGPEAPATPPATSPTPGGAPTPDVAPAAPPRRSRSASGGSASQRPAPDESPAPPAARPPRRSRSASDGSASQQRPADGPAEPPSAPARRSRSASGGSASQRSASTSEADARDGAQNPSTDPPGGTPRPPRRVRSADAPWHDAQPAFDEPDPGGPTAGPTGARDSRPEHTDPAQPEPERTEPDHAEPEKRPDPDHAEPEKRIAPDGPAPDHPHPRPDHPAGGDPE
ncbi:MULTISPECIES: NADH-quinone oxidoreductase subunit C [Streptomyces]|uniref:NADH-quinone oxidoreductase subunit C n=1 Tax=Streptomyces TaxID=1883 RepID=UPI000997BA8D|nr:MULTISPECIES: NADH-quinone oxidoreductase subunit C [Streptomyces]MDP9951421.1 NADH:ubiquinone oxidoreductase subunit C [Streptomyces sp. DSM 41269]